MAEQLVKPRTPKEIFAAKQEQDIQAEQDKRSRLIKFVEDRMLEQKYDTYRGNGYEIPCEEFPKEFGGDQSHIHHYVSSVYSKSGWEVDNNLDKDGKPLICFSTINGR